MDLTTLEANKNLIIKHTFGVAGTEFTQDVNIPFTPDYMIVRMINYRAVGSTDTPDNYIINSDIIGDNIGSFSISEIEPTPVVTSFPTFPNLIFKVGQSLQGTKKFTMIPVSGTGHNLNGQLIIHLDFVKLKSQTPQKVL